MAAFPPKLQVQLSENKRFQKLKEIFTEKFGESPLFYAYAPGRINLIGEHIDYCGYAVLPMAVEQNILVAVSVNKSPTIELANTNPQYKDFTAATDNIVIDRTKPQWYYYFMCGVKGIQEHFGLTSMAGMRCVVDGTVPPSSGLSSSSALVCCAGLVTLEANQRTLSKVELAEICTRCERYIGTEGGGMDQSISFLAEEGKAKLIEFSPLRATDVKLPAGAVFVVANCCVEMNKAATSHFNTRVAECRLAAKTPRAPGAVAGPRSRRGPFPYALTSVHQGGVAPVQVVPAVRQLLPEEAIFHTAARCWPRTETWTGAGCRGWVRCRRSWAPPWRTCWPWWRRCCGQNPTAVRRSAKFWASARRNWRAAC
uniref:Galactokinase 2 n=1 Tax=Paramormyrops kingsleyae TaxID=1676925 RepID=A0A3B3Q3U9_9TELE